MSETTTETSLPLPTIGLVGAGRIGAAVARLAVEAGHDVVLSNSRGPETLDDLVSDLGPRARAGTTEEAAQAGEVVVVTIPMKALGSVPVAPLAGKTVLDTINYYPDRDGRLPALDEHRATTSGLVQEHLSGARVVKAFGTMHSDAIGRLARPAGAADRSALPLYGDDPAATAEVVALLDRWGFDAWDGGGLAESWRVENGQPAYAVPYAVGDDLTEVQPADAATIAQLADRADRDDVELFTFDAPEG